MNFSFNIFGKNGRTDLYYKSDEKRLLQQIAEKSQEKSQMVVYRENSTICYIYIKRLSERDDFLGICLKFNGFFCANNKKIFDFFEDAIKNKIEQKKKIIESDLNGHITFVTNDFSKNEVDIKYLNKLFQDKIDTDFKNDFVAIEAALFEEGNNQQQYVSFKDEPEYIIESLMKYNYVTITHLPIKHSQSHSEFEKRIIEFKQKKKWINLTSGLVIVLISIFLIAGLINEKYTFRNVIYLEIPLVLSFYFLFFEKFTKGKNEILLAVFSLIISILGMALTIDNSVFSLSDGNYVNILKRSFKKDNIIDISSSLNEWDIMPDLVFVLDVSGSTKQKEYGNLEEAKELFNDVCKNLKGDTADVEKVLEKFLNKDKRSNKLYTEYDVYKLKILNIVAHNQERYKDKIHVVCFAGDVCSRRYVDCNSIIKFINNIESNKQFIENNKTDFIKLIKELSRLFGLNPLKNSSQAPKFTFLFFSDYLHDIDRVISTQEKNQIIRTIATSINGLYLKQNFSNYFFINPFPVRGSNKEIPVFEIFRDLANENSKAHFPKIEDEEYDFMDILPQEVVPIYYEHSYPIDHLKTKITFINIGGRDSVRISLRSNSNSMADFHQQFTIFEQDTIPVFSSNEVEISPSTSLTLSFSGRIIDNYSSTLLTFQSTNHNHSRFDIVFFKDLPGFVRYFIASAIFFFYLSILSMIVLLVSSKNKIIKLFALR